MWRENPNFSRTVLDFAKAKLLNNFISQPKLRGLDSQPEADSPMAKNLDL